MNKKNITRITITVNYDERGELTKTVFKAKDENNIKAVEAIAILHQAIGQILDEIV